MDDELKDVHPASIDRVVLCRKPDGSLVYTTRECIAEYGLDLLRKEAKKDWENHDNLHRPG